MKKVLGNLLLTSDLEQGLRLRDVNLNHLGEERKEDKEVVGLTEEEESQSQVGEVMKEEGRLDESQLQSPVPGNQDGNGKVGVEEVNKKEGNMEQRTKQISRIQAGIGQECTVS